MPSGDSTPSASGLDSRCSPRSWLTSGGPSSLRLVEYQNVSGRPTLFSSKPAALCVATDDLRLSSGLYAFGGARDFLPLQPVCAIRAGRGAGPPWPIGRGLPRLVRVHPRLVGVHLVLRACLPCADCPGRGRHDPRLSGKTFGSSDR